MAAQSQATLNAAASAIRGMWTPQQAAQAAAAALQSGANTVANGISTGGNGQLPGLVVDPRVGAGVPNLWINASQPTQTTSNGQTTVTIDQTAPQAVMTWLYYNVGANTTVVYRQEVGGVTLPLGQGNPSWVALNRIDATGVPSQILGSIKADGTVLLINPNGIIFGGASQINVHSLIATSFDIDGTTAASAFNGSSAYTALSVNGITFEAPPEEASSNLYFVANGLYTLAVPGTSQPNYGNSVQFAMGNQSLSTAALPGVPGSGRGSIVVEAGASITNTVNATGDGGYVALLGSSVTNSGSIVTQAGQIILAAGNAALLTEPSSAATGVNTAISLNQTLTGVATFSSTAFQGSLQTLTLSAGDNSVTNNGLLISNEGAVTIGTYLTNGTITQNGAIEATTSTQRIGSITLQTAGEAIFAPTSVTAILPDPNSGTVPVSAATGLQPAITIEGDQGIDFQSGSLLRAPSAALKLMSNNNVVLESGATIDLSGLANVEVPVTNYLVTFVVTANEVANDPLARSLIGTTVTIDSRVGSPIIDDTGYANLIQESIGQVLTAGGSVSVSSPNGGAATLIQKPGSLIDISGGYVTFTGGTINTTKLLGSDGRIYDIGKASTAISYVGIAGEFTVEHPHWGVTQTFTNPLLRGTYYDPTYIAGASAGSLSVTGLPVLDGTILGETVTGRRQRANAIGGGTTAQASLEALPAGASLTITSGASFWFETSAQAGSDPFGLSNYVFGSTWTAPSTVALLTDKLSAVDFASITVQGTSTGGYPTVNMTAGSVLTVAPGGSVNLQGVQLIDGTINAPSGKITLSGYVYDTSASSSNGVPNLSPVTIGSGAVLNVAGLWVNDTGAIGDEVQGQAFINGGSVSISTTAAAYHTTDGFSSSDVTQSIILAAGSVIDLSSGGYVGSNGKLAIGSDGLPKGNGGSLSLLTYSGGWAAPYAIGKDGTFRSAPTGGNEPTAATVVMAGTIYADSFDTGGTFTLQAPAITIDGAATSVTSYTSGANAGTIVLPTSFFTDNGFSNYVLTSVYGSTTVTAGTHLLLQQSNYLSGVGGGGTVLSNLTTLGAAAGVIPADVLALTLQPTGATVRDFAEIGLAPDGLRNPVSLTLNQIVYGFDQTGPATRATVLVDAGATITAEANASKQASINLTAQGPVTVFGSIFAPGGSITLTSTLLSGVGFTGVTGASDVWIGANAVLDVSGIYVPNPSIANYQTGSVLDGGTITLSGDTAVVALPGSQFKLEGTSAQIQMPSGSVNLSQRFVTQEIWSDGGTLALNGNVYFAGNVAAAGGAPLASGGMLDVSGGSIIVEPAGLIGSLLSPIPYAVPTVTVNTNTYTYNAAAFIGTDTLNNSGFESIILNAGTSAAPGTGVIAFNGSEAINVPGSLILQGNLMLMQASTGLLAPNVTNFYTYNATSNSTGYQAPTCAGAGCIPSIGGATVDLTAGYFWLSSGASSPSPSAADGTLNVTAQWIDLGSPMTGANGASMTSLVNVGNATFTSADAIRLIGYPTSTNATSTFLGGLYTAGNLTLQAAEIYPTSGTSFVLMSTGTAANYNSLTINQKGAASQPLSAGGTLILDAVNINQNGTVWAPFGQVVVGLTPATVASLDAANSGLSALLAPSVATQNVTLGAGSLTSVSGNGSLVPYGFTLDGLAWYVGNTETLGANVTSTMGTPATASPTKAITLSGANVTTASGAVLDLSGGGDIYATEFVSGTGGTTNVLAGSTVYALVPASTAKVAPYDPTFAGGTNAGAVYNSSLINVTAGSAIFIAGGNGIAAGYYTLMPGMYATLPGAYRVTVASTPVKTAASQSYTTDDGSLYVTGSFANMITGARSSQTVLFELQSGPVWSKYSDITITSGTSFFSGLAATAGTAPPALPIDGGILTFAASSTLSIESTNRFAAGISSLAPGITGLGGQADITANNILVLASDKIAPAADAGYLVLNADQISGLGAMTVIIGGTSSIDGSGNLALTAGATNLDVETDAAHPLGAPQLILVTQAGGSGITVEDGSVIAAVGSLPSSNNRNMTIGGDGSLLRVSNGTMVNLTRSGTLSGTGNISIGDNVTINGGGALTLASSGNNQLGSNVTLTANAFDLSAKVINIGGGTSGLVLDDAIIANFAGAASVLLQSASVVNFYDASGLTVGNSNNPIDTLTFDGAGLYSQGGTTTIDAANVVFTNSQATPNIANVASAAVTGTLNVNAGGTLTFGATPAAVMQGSQTNSYGFTIGNFNQVNVTADQGIAFSGSGNFGAGAASVTFTAPNIIAAAGSSQSLTTGGDLTIASNGLAASVAATEIGGSLTLTAASVKDYGTITALSGTVSLTATGATSPSDPTAGAVTLYPGATINAGGSEIVLGPVVEDAPGGTVNLTSQNGNVMLYSNAVLSSLVNVAAAGSGYAGAVNIDAPNGAVTLEGTLKGAAAYNDIGGTFTLVAGSLNPNDSLPFTSGFTGNFAVELGQGNITIAAGQTLTSGKVLLVANNGSIDVEGTIDASGPTGGSIGLYAIGTSTAQAGTAGANGVTIGSDAKLYARYQADDPNDPAYANGTSNLVQTGGTITLGTTGVPDTTLNAAYGYEDVPASGAITVASGATFDVSGGPGGTNINNTGGSVTVRAPNLTTNNINVSFKGTIVTNADANGNPSGNGVIADAYAVWSTTDSCTLIAGGCSAITTVAQFNALTPAQQAQLEAHFDGIIDPAGFFNGAGTQIISATGGLYPNSTYASPATGAYLPHVDFYQNTLLKFVDNPFNDPAGTTTNTAAVQNDFAGAQIQIAGSNTTSPLPSSKLHLQPEIDLVNPSPATGSTSINNGNITVASNWNLGAGVYNTATGAFSLYYRTTTGGAPGVLSLRTTNNILIDATISDGFYETSDPMFPITTPAGTGNSLALEQDEYLYGNLTGATNTIGPGQYASLTYMPGFTGIIAPQNIAFPTSYSLVAEQNTWYAYYYYYYVHYGLNLALQTVGIAPSANYIGGSYDPNAGDYASTAIYNAAMAKGTFDNVPTDYTSYAAYVTAFNKYYVGSTYYTSSIGTYTNGELSATFATPASSVNGTTQNLTNFDNNPTDYTSYVNYVTAYKDYFAVMHTFMSSYYAAHTTQTSGLPSPILAPLPPPAVGTAYAGGATEVATLYRTDYETQYLNNAYYLDYNTYYYTYAVEPGHVTGKTTATSYGSSLWLNVIPYLPLVADTPAVSIPTTGAPGPANMIANNPAANASVATNDYNTTSAASLMPASLGNSFSYSFTAGAYFPASGAASVDPNAVVLLTSTVNTASPVDSIVISGHTSYTDPLSTSQTVNVPTLVRTGTGSITLAAPGDVLFTDPVIEGAVYTAGAAVTTPSDFSAPGLGAKYAATPNGLVSTLAWGTGGGAITVDAGQSILAAVGTVSETTADWYDRYGKSNGTATSFSSCAAAGSTACQNAAWVNYATFFQNFGALGGGNISLRAGGAITNISTAQPQTFFVSGGTVASDPVVEHVYGGGDLLVQAGGNVNGGSFYVGQGAGLITASGAVTGSPQLFIQDSYIDMVAGGALSLGSVSDPASLGINTDYILGLTNLVNLASGYQVGSSNSNYWGAYFTTYGPEAGLSLTSLTGNATATFSTFNAQSGSVVGSIVLPGLLSITAPLGNITINTAAPVGYSTTTVMLAYSTDASGDDTGGLTLAAGGTITLAGGGMLALEDTLLLSENSYTGLIGGNPLGLTSYAYAPANLATSDPVVLYAGRDILSGALASGGSMLSVNRPAEIQAGRDINLSFIGENLSDGDVTALIAGRDVLGSDLLYGPGALLIEAGRNVTTGGIVAVGNGAAGAGTTSLSTSFGKSMITLGTYLGTYAGTNTRAYLPAQSANVTVLFGVGPGVDYADAISQYVNPASAGSGGIDFLTDIAARLGQSPDQAWATFEGFSVQRQQLWVDRAFLDFLTTVATDYRNASSPYYGQYARAYSAIDTLFPARYGYTNNATGSGANGAAATIKTGDLNMRYALIETQQGGDINLIGPGGGITVGTVGQDSIASGRGGQSKEGILTLRGGDISIFTDGSVLVNQSRIMTEEGGDIGIFSANGDINAGSGPKTYFTNPIIAEICDMDGYCAANAGGLVTGAGIAAVLSLPNQDPKKSNATLVAPHGTVDAGAAGIRTAGNLNIVALQVLNSYNISAQGTTQGLQTTAAPNVGALTSANSTAGASQAGVSQPQKQNNAPSEVPSLISVEVLGYGGGSSDGGNSGTGAPLNELHVPNSEMDQRRRGSPPL
ncbi:filamentous haemagglutinin family protein [Methyloferula stellata]|uniref:filamentous haemagglutinin family protein n=1 Tax=Methyloferula stellata TaxID=876270 RepID=UPI00039F9F97|nr:filamentous haemagglutinin family protein [Methyloferula stellata]